jgi:hypothetical protein
MRIWQIEPSYLTDAFRDFYEESPLNITRILDVAQDLKVSVLSDFMCDAELLPRYWSHCCKYSPSYSRWTLQLSHLVESI